MYTKKAQMKSDVNIKSASKANYIIENVCLSVKIVPEAEVRFIDVTRLVTDDLLLFNSLLV